MDFKRLIDVAKALKLTEQTGRCFHSAFAVKQGKIICVGINRYNKTNRISATYKLVKETTVKNFMPSIHAESDLIGKLKRMDSFNRLQMVSIRINNKNEVDDACPCSNCSFELGRVDFKHIWYSTKNGFNRFP